MERRLAASRCAGRLAQSKLIGPGTSFPNGRKSFHPMTISSRSVMVVGYLPRLQEFVTHA